MKYSLAFFTLILFFSKNLFAQDFKNIDWVYSENIKTVRFLPSSVTQTSLNVDKKNKEFNISSSPELELMPLINLGETAYLSFDDMDGDFKFLRYKLELRNADWSPTQLNEQEYIEGFMDYRFNEGKLSFGVTTSYTHYTLLVPNQNVKITKSGNYLLHVFIDDDKKTPVLTRRMVVAEKMSVVNARFTQTGSAEKTYTHQEIDFDVLHEKLRINNPKAEIKAVVLQNGRWDNAKMNLQPNFVRINEMMFDYQDSIVFPAGNEFRFFDIRTLMSRGFRVQKVKSTKTSYDVTLINDKRRLGQTYIFNFDNNGTFVIDTRDAPRGDLNVNLQSEYANVLFTLDTKQEIDNADVYVVGKFSDWQALPQNQMLYDDLTNTYIAELPMKQGFYDYAYAVVKKGSTKLDLEEIDENLYQTDNQYTIIVYHRPPGGRYDRVIGFRTLGFDPNKRF